MAASAICSSCVSNFFAAWERVEVRSPPCARGVNNGVRYIFIFKPALAAIPIKNFLPGRDAFCGLENALCICMYVCMYGCAHASMHMYACVCMYACTPTHLKIHVVIPYRYNCSRIGTVMVVKKRAVTQRQGLVRPVVMEHIMPRGQTRRQVFR